MWLSKIYQLLEKQIEISSKLLQGLLALRAGGDISTQTNLLNSHKFALQKKQQQQQKPKNLN